MTFNVPNDFVPQSGQAISSQQMDENFDAVEAQIDSLTTLVGGGSGTVTEARKILYSLRPAYTGVAAPASNELIDRKYLEATRGCAIGDIILSINPATLSTNYGVVWAKMEGQQLSQATYPEFYAICQSIGGADTGRYNPAAGATSGNFVAPDWRGRGPVQLLSSGSALGAQVPNVVAANWLGSLIGESAHTQTIAEMPAHTHGPKSPATHIPMSGGGGSGAFTGGSSYGSYTETGSAGSGNPFNVTDAGFMALLWVRIK